MPSSPDAERLERCAGLCAERAWRLASALLRDRDAAYDAVQQALLVAARKPERVPRDDPWPWFSAVLVHEVRNLRRKRWPLTNQMDAADGGLLMERADTGRDAPDAAAERGEEAQRLWSAVEALPSPEREALLLTHHAGLTHAEAAAALGVPRQTLTSQAGRGLDTLARRLGHDPSRAASALAAIPVLEPSGGLTKAILAWTKAALSVEGPGAGIIAAAAAEGALVATKTLWMAGVALALGAGFVGGAASEGFGMFSPAGRGAASPPALESAPEPAEVGRAGPRLEGPAQTEAGVRTRLEAENSRLAARLAAAEQEITALKAPDGGVGSASSGTATFTFGEGGRLDAVRKTNWATIAAAGKIVQDAVVEMHVLTKAGEPVPKATLLRLQENVEKMRTYEYATIDKLPTSAQHNGEFTHPISLTNLVAATLSGAGQPLSAAQVADIDRLGTVFDQEFAALRERWSAGVPRARRMLEEYRLKGDFCADLQAALTDQQRAALMDPTYRGRAGLDLNDATLMILHTSPVITGADAGQVRGKLATLLRKKLGLAPESAAPILDGLLDTFLARALRGMESVPASQARYYSYAQGLQAGEAMADLVDGVLRDVELAAPVREALLGDPTWYIPRLVSP